jgi:hypothetical protein
MSAAVPGAVDLNQSLATGALQLAQAIKGELHTDLTGLGLDINRRKIFDHTLKIDAALFGE